MSHTHACTHARSTPRLLTYEVSLALVHPVSQTETQRRSITSLRAIVFQDTLGECACVFTRRRTHICNTCERVFVCVCVRVCERESVFVTCACVYMCERNTFKPAVHDKHKEAIKINTLACSSFCLQSTKYNICMHTHDMLHVCACNDSFMCVI